MIIGLVDKALTCGFRKRGSPRFWARKWPNCASELDIRGSAEYYSVCFAKEWAVSLLAIVKKEVSIRGKDLESGRLARNGNELYDRKDIEQMGLANAGTTCAVPAAKARNPLVAFIAVVFVAAALLFAMPSLAYASSEAEASPQASEAQEILLSQKESSTSANKTPDESPTPPGYTAQDAFNIDLGAKATEVDLVFWGRC